MDRELVQELVALVPQMRRFALSLTGSAAEADDVVQGAVERAIRHIDTWRRGTRLDSWLYRIVQNQFLNTVRAERVRSRFSAAERQTATNATDGVGGIEARLTLKAVQTQLQALEPEQRAALVLVCVEGQSYAQAAETLGVPVGTITSRLGRARAQLKRVLYADDDEDGRDIGGIGHDD